jgi:hypothetical protein
MGAQLDRNSSFGEESVIRKDAESLNSSDFGSE